MPYDKVNYADVEAKAPSMHFLRDALGCDKLGITVLDPEAGWTGKEHAHVDREHEEVYLLVEGAARITVDDEAVELGPGDAIRVDPHSSRQLHVTEDSLIVIAGAP